MPPKKLGASKCLPSGVGQGFAVVVGGGSVVGASVGGSVGGSVVGGSVGGGVVGGSVGAGVGVVVVSGGGSVVGGSVGVSVVGISVVVGVSVVVVALAQETSSHISELGFFWQLGSSSVHWTQ